jgi:hypothetical protein
MEYCSCAGRVLLAIPLHLFHLFPLLIRRRFYAVSDRLHFSNDRYFFEIDRGAWPSFREVLVRHWPGRLAIVRKDSRGKIYER